MVLYYLYPILIIICILIQSFFSNSEMSMVSSNKIRLRYLAKNGDKRAVIIQQLLNSPDRLFGTTLVGINLATVVASTFADLFFTRVINDYVSPLTEFIPMNLVILLIMEPIVLIFGEFFPMSMARKYPTTTALRNAPFIKIAYFILFPLMLLPVCISKMIMRLLRVTKSSVISRKEMEVLVTGGYSKVTNKTQEFIKEIFNINELVASDIMVHINEIISISHDSTVGEVKELICSSGHSRLPIYRDNIFNIIATIHAGDIVGVDDKEPVMPYTDKLYIVPSSKPLIQILSELKNNRKYMGIVVDEYGVVVGLISLEDILEEIVGEINDEYDDPAIPVSEENQEIFDATIRLDEFFEKTGIDFRDTEAETISGIINLAIGRIARKNEKVTFRGIQFEIIDASDRLVKSVRVTGCALNQPVV